MIWAAILATSVGSYLQKLGGLSVPGHVLEKPVVRRVAILLPIALLVALTAVQTFASGKSVVVDARAAGLAFAVVTLMLRANFLIVIFGAAAFAAGIRALG